MPRDYSFTMYFMYGAQVLNHAHFDRQFATCRPEGQGVLKGWRMDFSRQGGQPNLVKDGQSKVDGLVWLVESAELPKLEQIEAGAHRHEGTVLWRGKEEPAVFYVADSAPSSPSKEFIQKLRDAYKVALLPQAQIDRALGIPVGKH
jgi:hypothetical protein